MSDDISRASAQGLQFDRVLTETSPSIVPARPSVECESCHVPLETEYYQINGHTFCERCRAGIEASAETPRGIRPLLTAGIFGLGAGIVGAVIYYGVIALTNFEIGLVAILIGYMVGYAVRRVRERPRRTTVSGARRGPDVPGRGVCLHANRGQAVYCGASRITAPGRGYERRVHEQCRRVIAARCRDPARCHVHPRRPDRGSAAARRGRVVASGLISGLIILIGMRQAWRMTGAPSLEIYGPYRVGGEPTTKSA